MAMSPQSAINNVHSETAVIHRTPIIVYPLLKKKLVKRDVCRELE
jgi:hypothetical protein